MYIIMYIYNIYIHTSEFWSWSFQSFHLPELLIFLTFHRKIAPLIDSGWRLRDRHGNKKNRKRKKVQKWHSQDQCRPVCVRVFIGWDRYIYIYFYRSGQASIPQPKRHRTAKRPVQMFRLGWHRNCPSPVSGRLPPGMLHGSCCPLLSESTGPWCSAHVTGLWLWKQLKHNVNIIHIIDWRYSSTEF